jgi:UDP-N-acetylglucosamine 2-epimerase (non-hydrolysing)
MSKKQRILVVAGARPNFVKVGPIIRVLRTQESCDSLLVHTGQHYDKLMSDLFFEQLRIPSPDVNLEVGSGSHARQTAEVMIRFDPIVAEWKPDLLIVVGDVNSTIACALVAAKHGVRIAHIESGLRSFDRSMPEELNRILTDALSDYLFVTEPSGVTNLLREGTPAKKIFLVGNVMIDSLSACLPLARKSSALSNLGLEILSNGESAVRPYALVTLHRPSNVDDKSKLKGLVEVLFELGKRLPVIFPAHPRTSKILGDLDVACRFRTGPPPCDEGVWVVPPAGYLEFLHMLSAATLVLTDSGGIQEETTVLGVPCLTLRENTERPITVEQGTNLLVGTEPASVLAAATQVLSDGGKRGRRPDLWDGQTSNRIVAILLERLGHAGVYGGDMQSSLEVIQ